MGRRLVALVLRSIESWLTLLFLAVLALALTTIYLVTVNEIERHLVGQRTDHLTSAKALVQDTLYSSLHPDPVSGRILIQREPMDSRLGFLDDRVDARVVVLDVRSNLIADSQPVPHFQLSAYGAFANQARVDRVVVSGTRSVRGERYVIVAIPVMHASMQDPTQDIVAAVVVLVSPLKDVYQTVSDVKQVLLLASALALALALTMSFLAARQISGRLKRIEKSATVLATGDFNVTVNGGFGDEIGRLADTFNLMGGTLRAAFRQLGREKEQVVRERDRMDLLLRGLTEGVIGISRDDSIVVANPSAVGLLGLAISPNSRADAVLPAELVRALRESLTTNEVVTTTLERIDSVLVADVYPTADESEIASILVVRDTTKEAKLDRARRDFVANASHELKTPLFSISGCIELLADGQLDQPTGRKFLGHLRQQVNRLEQLTVGLLDLSRLESGAVTPRAAKTDVAALVQRTIDETQSAAAARSVKIAADGARNAVWLNSDEEMLARVLRILLDNAVKASPPNSRVTVELTDESTAIRLGVFDEGTGLSSDQVESVFERFHRASGSGAGQGFGLGLSIARELVSLLNGAIWAEAANGHGGHFYVRLPKRLA